MKRKNQADFEEVLAEIEKKRTEVSERMTFFQFENAFFLPLFALLFLISYISINSMVKLFFFIVVVVLVIADFVYSTVLFVRINQKQKDLDKLISKKLGM